MPSTPESTENRSAIVLDTTVLSNFALIGQFQLLERLYAGRACATLMVAEEIHRGIEAGYRALEVIESALGPAGWLSVVAIQADDEHVSYVSLLASLGAGEASCLAVARSRDMILATDDRAARREAAQLGVPVTGTLGMLVRLVREGHVSLMHANDLLSQMIQQGYRSPIEQLGDLL